MLGMGVPFASHAAADSSGRRWSGMMKPAIRSLGRAERYASVAARSGFSANGVENIARCGH
jgi:hypothetical protein